MKWQEIQGPAIADLDWSTENRIAALAELFGRTNGYSLRTEEWYAAKRRAKRPWGRALRVGAIALGAVAAILPVISEIYSGDGRPPVAPAWSTVALILAATLIGLDRYFGFSAAWMRFMAAELRLARRRHEFEYKWQAQKVRVGTDVSDEELATFLDLSGELTRAVDQTVSDETEGWIEEFRSSLDRVEQGVRQTASDG
jgi:hypothetical protein